MDVNGDGKLDILSGSYSRTHEVMAGLFYVLLGTDDGFARAEVLNGTDGKALMIQPAGDGGDGNVDRICTRPTAVDLDGDGKLDIVAGNFRGTFAFFKGEGEGRFSPISSWLTNDDDTLRVNGKSDPFFVDWDGDGDMDLLSGSSSGGAFMFPNEGSATKPSFGARVELLEPAPDGRDKKLAFDEGDITKPASGTRLWVDDVNDDGKLDLLLGDWAQINTPVEGMDEATCRKKIAELDAEQVEVRQAIERGDDGAMARFVQIQDARGETMTSTSTGFVWLMLQKKASNGTDPTSRIDEAQDTFEALDKEWTDAREAYHQARAELMASDAYKAAGEAGDRDTMSELRDSLKSPDGVTFAKRFLSAAENFKGAENEALFLAKAYAITGEPEIRTASLDGLLARHAESDVWLKVTDRWAYLHSVAPDAFDSYSEKVLSANEDKVVHANVYLGMFNVKRDSEDQKVLASWKAKISELAPDSIAAFIAEGDDFERERLQIGMVAPDIEGADTAGERFKLSDYRGRVVVLDFWGDW